MREISKNENVPFSYIEANREEMCWDLISSNSFKEEKEKYMLPSIIKIQRWWTNHMYNPSKPYCKKRQTKIYNALVMEVNMLNI